MKKALIFLMICIGSILSGCNNEYRIKFIDIFKLEEDIIDAEEQKYDHITVDSNVIIPNVREMHSYKYRKEKTFNSEHDDRCIKLIELLFDYDDFNKDKNPHDDITVDHTGENDEVITFYNYTKEEFAVFYSSGKVYVGGNIDSKEFSSINAAAKITDAPSKEHKEVIDTANSFLLSVKNILSITPLKATAIMEGLNEKSEKIYKVYFEQPIEETSIDSFGTFYASQGDMKKFSYYTASNSVVIDNNKNVISFEFEGQYYLENNNELTECPSISSVLNYIDKELAPNIDLKVTDIKFRYAVGIQSGELTPVWIIESCRPKESLNDCTRFFVNCNTGDMEYVINGSHGIKEFCE